MSASETETSERVPLLPRLESGSQELDAILGGGFPAHSINILMGEPGSGKTILAERLMFANADPHGRPILFFTTLSEPLDKVIRYLQQFRFYDEQMLTGAILYEPLGQELVEQGIAAVVPRLKEAITTHKPKIIVIDSFKAIHDLSGSIAEMRRMLFEMAGLLTAYETTAFLVGEYSADQIGIYPEFAVADGMVELARHKLGTRDERYLRVLKLRGSPYLEGLHAFRITPDGLEVHPRLVSPQTPPDYDMHKERVPTGIAGLDALLGSGLPRGRSTFLLGPTGSGKTTLALQFVLEGLRRGESALYVSFQENPTQLDAQILALGMPPEETRERGLHFLYVSPVELQIDSIVATVFRHLQQHNIRRLAFDAVGDLLMAASDVQRTHSYLYALSQHFASRGVTSLFLWEATTSGLDLQTRLSALADNILQLNIELHGGQAQRTLRVVKVRGIQHDLHAHPLQITDQGLQVS